MKNVLSYQLYSLRESMDYENWVLDNLKKVAKRFNRFSDFSYHYSHDVNHGYYWHVTKDERFSFSTEYIPKDVVNDMQGDEHQGGAYITSDLENWDYTYNYNDEDERVTRPYVALVDATDVDPQYLRQITRGFGNEISLPAAQARLLKVVAVLPRADALALDERLHRLIPTSEEELEQLYHQAQHTKNPL